MQLNKFNTLEDLLRYLLDASANGMGRPVCDLTLNLSFDPTGIAVLTFTPVGFDYEAARFSVHGNQLIPPQDVNEAQRQVAQAQAEARARAKTAAENEILDAAERIKQAREAAAKPAEAPVVSTPQLTPGA